MSRRRLSDDERALWGGFARGVTPLRRDAGGALGVVSDRTAHETPPVQSGPKERLHAKQPPALAQFDRRLRQRVARGHLAIDVRLDLHGMTQKQAHAALLHFLPQAQAQDPKRASGDWQGHWRRGFGGRTRRAAATSAIVAIAAGVPPLYRQLPRSARRPRRRRRAVPALAAPLALAAAAAIHTRC